MKMSGEAQNWSNFQMKFLKAVKTGIWILAAEEFKKQGLIASL